MPADVPRTEPLLSPGDLTFVVVTFIAAVTVLDALIGGALAGLLFGHGWAWPRTTTIASTLGHLVTHPGSPAAAYPEPTRPLLPGPHPYWGAVERWSRSKHSPAPFRRLLSRPPGQGRARHSVRPSPGHGRTRPWRTDRRPPRWDRPPPRRGLRHRHRARSRRQDHAPGRRVYRRRPGAIVATSTKADLVTLTARDPHLNGAAHVFDPDQLLDWPRPCRWDAVAGCQTSGGPTRARAMVAARPLRGDRNSGFFEGASETVLRCLLHAAALDNASMRDVVA